MDKRRENTGWTPVPQFGAWDQNAGGNTDYSVVFSKARANRKQHKANAMHASLGSERELVSNHHQHHRNQHHKRPHRAQDDEPVTKKKRILTYINCCIRPY